MMNDNLVTAAEIGIGREEQIRIALQAMIANGGAAEIQRIYAAVEDKLKEKGHELSEQGKATLRSYVNRDAVTAGYARKASPGWQITAQGREFLGEAIEDDEDTREADTYEDGSIYPYEMPEEVDIREDPHSVFEWMRKLQRGQLIIDPEFQRNLVWKPIQKSQFIESVLLNIPITPLYVNQTRGGKYIIVDGRQRTSTLNEFISDQFELKGLQVLTELNDLKFSQLSTKLQTRIEDKKLWIYVIKPSVSLPMVYDIFHRINTGGTQLTRQEVRNCFYIGPSTRLLKELSEQEYFRQAIDWGISPKRMKDREAVLRYLAFRIFDYETDYKNDMDAFLGETLEKINKMSDNEIDDLRQDFERVMKLTFDFFGERNFRLPTVSTRGVSTRGRVNIALLESISYFFAIKSDAFLQKHKEKIIANFEDLIVHEGFINAVKLATGDKNRVKTRFDLAQEILGRV